MNKDSPTTGSRTADENHRGARIAEFDQRTDSATQAIVTAVAELAGRSPTSLDPLYSVVDPDSLDDLVNSVASPSSPSSLALTFRYHGCTITVHSHGVVEVVQRDDL